MEIRDDRDRLNPAAALGRRGRRGFVVQLAGRPLTRFSMSCLMLIEARKVMRYRAGLRGIAPTTAEIDLALWRIFELRESLPELYSPLDEPPVWH